MTLYLEHSKRPIIASSKLAYIFLIAVIPLSVASYCFVRWIGYETVSLVLLSDLVGISAVLLAVGTVSFAIDITRYL